MKRKNKYKSEFLQTTECGFQYVVNDDLRDMIDRVVNKEKSIELLRYSHDINTDIVITLKAEVKENGETN